MKTTKFGQTFFESTRGQIVSRLRRGASTVEELAQLLGLTDNAVRAHLATLERDGLVERSGVVRGLRKPHFAYKLTDEAEHLFPKAYHTLLNQLLMVLKQRLAPKELRAILREVARLLASERTSIELNESVESRAQRAIAAMEAMGGVTMLERDSGKLFIRSSSGCPFADSVSEHPEICQLAETLLSEIMGLEVREHCQREKSPQCSFEVATELSGRESGRTRRVRGTISGSGGKHGAKR